MNKDLAMKNILYCLVMGLSFWATIVNADEAEGKTAMKIKLTYNDKIVIVKMKDNFASRQLMEMLPATFEFIDFAGQEKITEFPKPISLNGVSRGMIAKAGKMFIYVPWGNLGFFYKDHGDNMDNNLVELGEIESGLDVLSSQKGGFSAEMTVLTGTD